MKILVTGAKGMLGQDLCPIFENAGFDVVKTDVDTLDITDPARVERVLSDIKPDYLIHCAAYTDVDGAQSDPDTALLINKTGTENIAKASAKIGTTLIYISTDYVFNGEKTAPYEPDDIPSPLNNYGLSKLKGEEAVKKNCEKYYIVRTSWLYGRCGKNFVETMISLADKPCLKVVNDQTGCPTYSVDLSEAMLALVQEKAPYGIYHLCGGGMTSWFDFAKEIFKLSGLSVNLQPCSTADFPRPAIRPKFSAMNNNGTCRDWKIALEEYFKKRGHSESFNNHGKL